MTETIRKIHKDSKNAYGSLRVHAELVLEHGMAISPKRVAALMQAAQLVGVRRRKLLGYAKAEHTRAELVVDAATMSATQSQLAGVCIHRSNTVSTPRRSSATP